MPWGQRVGGAGPLGMTRRHWGATFLAGLTGGCRKPISTAVKPAGPRRAGALAQHAYVWQRAWTPAVGTGVRAATGKIGGLTVLAAEIEWKDGQPRLNRPKIDVPALKATGVPVAMAVRIGPWGGPFEAGDARTVQIRAWIAETLTMARRDGWEPSAWQIDFDSATAKLSGYLTWLRLFRDSVAPLPVSFTALPHWLTSPVLREMAALSGHFVLQVHAVERARAHDPQPTLIDPTSARRWVEQAAGFGVPFSVALPTYRSIVGFNAEGKIVGIDSEGPARAWPADTRLVSYLSPADELATLVAGWTADRPAALRDLIWYRLPVPGEARNWTWKTLSPVMAGRAPVRKLEVIRDGGNPLDLSVLNAGEAEVPWPESVRVNLRSAAHDIAAADALAGYELQHDPDTPRTAVFRCRRGLPDAFLPPGARKPLGWIRFTSDIASDDISITLS